MRTIKDPSKSKPDPKPFLHGQEVLISKNHSKYPGRLVYFSQYVGRNNVMAEVSLNKDLSDTIIVGRRQIKHVQ